jgi:hypothetical protein
MTNLCETMVFIGHINLYGTSGIDSLSIISQWMTNSGIK